jgi:hypothetical protein
MSTPQTVNVHISERLTTLDQAHKVLANVLGKLGCGGCFSGFDIRFSHFTDFSVDPKTLNVQEIGR